MLKSSTQLHEDELSPSNDSLFTRVCGMMVLKGELKDRDNVGSREACLYSPLKPGVLSV